VWMYSLRRFSACLEVTYADAKGILSCAPTEPMMML
jgi:hypothetical protein